MAYCKVARVVRIRDAFEHQTRVEELSEACGSEEIALEVIKAMKMSMGQDIVEMDMQNIDRFAGEVVALFTMRKTLHEYLKTKMDLVAPNLSALIGEIIGARLISHAGSLITLAKYPASTVQILGAEKALFRALKTKGNTPKYGLIFHSSFIGRAQQKNKGRISRYLANKCSIASRIDCFADESTDVFGKKLKDQVEERLKFYETGDAPRKNIDVMREAIKEIGGDADASGEKKAKKAKKEKKKRKAEDAEAEDDEAKPKKKKKKSAEGENDGKKKKTKKKEK